MKLLPGLPNDGVELPWFCAKGKMIYKAKKNLRIGEAELNCFLNTELAGAFPEPLLAEYSLMNQAGGPVKVGVGQVLEGQRLEFRGAPQTAPTLVAEYGALQIDRIERFERVKVPKLRLTVLARFPLNDQAAVWLKNSIGTTVFLTAHESQMPLPGTTLTEILGEEEEGDTEAQTELPLDGKSAAAGERSEDPRGDVRAPAAATDGLSGEARDKWYREQGMTTEAEEKPAATESKSVTKRKAAQRGRKS